jgi:tetratricopeptide (TPR) repeat protein
MGIGWLWLLLPLAPLLWFALAAWADHLCRMGHYDTALKLVPLIGIGANGRAYVRGDVLTDAGRYDEAERLLRRTIDHTRTSQGAAQVDFYFALEDLGSVLLDTGRFEEAQQCFESGASGTFPDRSRWAMGMAEVLLRQGLGPQAALERAEAALNSYRRGSERITNRARLGGILATRAWALAAFGREQEVRKAIDAALHSPARKTNGRSRRFTTRRECPCSRSRTVGAPATTSHGARNSIPSAVGAVSAPKACARASRLATLPPH